VSLNNTEAAAANLTALKRIDPTIVAVQATASHVALYSFDTETKAWVRLMFREAPTHARTRYYNFLQAKRNIDGVLYLVRREGGDYRLIVSNRSAPTTFVQDVVPNLEFQTKAPYLMYRNPAEAGTPVQGIWFHDPTELKEIVRAIKTVLKAPPISEPPATAPAPVPAPAPAPAAQRPIGDRGVLGQLGLSHTVTPTEPLSYASTAPTMAPTVAALFGSAPQLPPSMAAQGPTLSIPAYPASTSALAPAVSALSHAVAAATVPGGSLGEVSIILSKSQLQAVLLDLVQDDAFVSTLHNRYMQTVTQQLARR
jgi:hypothetical protein